MTWQPIETAPNNGAVLLYFANRIFWRADGVPVLYGPVRDQIERTEVAFCCDGDICAAGTGHSMWEEWRGPDGFPTAWMPLPAPPEAAP